MDDRHAHQARQRSSRQQRRRTHALDRCGLRASVTDNEEERVTMFFAGEGDEYVIAEADVETDTTLH